MGVNHFLFWVFDVVNSSKKKTNGSSWYYYLSNKLTFLLAIKVDQNQTSRTRKWCIFGYYVRFTPEDCLPSKTSREFFCKILKIKIQKLIFINFPLRAEECYLVGRTGSTVRAWIDSSKPAIVSMTIWL